MKTLYLTRLLTILSLLVLYNLQPLSAQENQQIEITGKVVDQETKTGLGGVSVLVKGTIAGTTTDQGGNFKLRSKLKFPFKLIFTSIGFKTQEFDVKNAGSQLNVELSTQT